MVNSGLLICSFYLKQRNKKKEKICLLNQNITNEDGESFGDIFNLFNNFCREHYNFSDDEKSMKMFSVESGSLKVKNTQTYRAVSFVINSGAYGIESNITNRRTKAVKYRRKKDDADIKRFYCLLLVPKDTEGVEVSKGILIFQTIANFGVKTITVGNLKTFFGQKNLTFETRSVSVRKFIENLNERGRLYKLTLIKNHVTADSSERMILSTGREERAFISPRLNDDWFSKVLNYIDNRNECDIFEIDDTIYDDIRITFILGNSSRSVRISDIDRFSVVEDIPESIYKNGVYREDTLIQYMIETAIAYKENMVFSINPEV